MSLDPQRVGSYFDILVLCLKRQFDDSTTSIKKFRLVGFHGTDFVPYWSLPPIPIFTSVLGHYDVKYPVLFLSWTLATLFVGDLSSTQCTGESTTEYYDGIENLKVWGYRVLNVLDDSMIEKWEVVITLRQEGLNTVLFQLKKYVNCRLFFSFVSVYSGDSYRKIYQWKF